MPPPSECRSDTQLASQQQRRACHFLPETLSGVRKGQVWTALCQLRLLESLEEPEHLRHNLNCSYPPCLRRQLRET